MGNMLICLLLILLSNLVVSEFISFEKCVVNYEFCVVKCNRLPILRQEVIGSVTKEWEGSDLIFRPCGPPDFEENKAEMKWEFGLLDDSELVIRASLSHEDLPEDTSVFLSCKTILSIESSDSTFLTFPPLCDVSETPSQVHANFGEHYGGNNYDAYEYYSGSYNDGVTFVLDDDDDTSYYYSDFNPFNIEAVSTGSFVANASFEGIKSLATYDDIVIVGGSSSSDLTNLISVFRYSDGIATAQYSFTADDFNVFPVLSSDGIHLALGAEYYVNMYDLDEEGIWTLTQTLERLESFSTFPSSVAVMGDYMLAGDYGEQAKIALLSSLSYSVDNVPALDSVYVYQLIDGVWTNTTKLEGDLASYFGYALACSPDQCLFGVPLGGVVYSYALVEGSWSRLSTITKTHDADSFFGASVSISGNYALVGSYMYASVAIYEFIENEWVFQNTIRAVSYDVSLNGYQVFIVSSLSDTEVFTYELVHSVGPSPTRKPSSMPKVWNFEFDVVQTLITDVNATAFNAKPGNGKVFTNTILQYLDLVTEPLEAEEAVLTINSVVDRTTHRLLRSALSLVNPDSKHHSSALYISYTVYYTATNENVGLDMYDSFSGALNNMTSTFSREFLIQANSFGGFENSFKYEDSVSTSIVSISEVSSYINQDDDDTTTGGSADTEKMRIIVASVVGGSVLLCVGLICAWFTGFGCCKRLKKSNKVHVVIEDGVEPTVREEERIKNNKKLHTISEEKVEPTRSYSI